jgi:hypothetical protein
MIKNDKKNEIKIANNEAHLTIIYPCIPMILQVRVMVCHGVPKSTTIPVPAIPVLETPRVYPYLYETLHVTILRDAAVVEMMSSGRSLMRTTLAWSQILNHVRRQKMSTMRE